MFEGLLWALPIDLGRTAGLFHGNYLLFGPLAWAFHHLLRAFGGPELSLYSLQALDGLLGAAGAVLFFFSLRVLELRRGASAAWTLVFVFAFARWKWCTDAEVYAFSSLTLAAALLGACLYARGKLGERGLGALHALATLGHLANGVLLLPLAALVVRRRGSGAARALGALVAVSAAIGAAAYGLALALFIRPESPAAAWHWLLGSANSPNGAVNWHGASGGLADYLRTTVRVFASSGPAFPQGRWAAASRLLPLGRAALAVLALAAAAGWRKLSDARRDVAAFCAAWLLAFALVFTSWEPATLRYRVGDAGAMTMLLALGAAQALGGASMEAAGALALLLALGNAGGEIAPRSRAANNPDLQRMAFIRAHTADGDWVTARGGREELYIPYFAQRRPLGVGFHEGDPQTVAAQAARLAAGGTGVYATDAVLADPKWAAAFAPLHPRETARAPQGWALYRLSVPSLPRKPTAP